MIRNIAIIGVLSVVLAGCATPQGLMARDAFLGKARGVSDETAKNLETALCALPYSAVVRNFGTDMNRARAYVTLCNAQVVIPPLAPNAPVNK